MPVRVRPRAPADGFGLFFADLLCFQAFCASNIAVNDIIKDGEINSMDQESRTLDEVMNNIEEVLDKLRPFLQREGGDIKVDSFSLDDGICYVDMIGACSGCYMASYDVTESVEVLLMDEVPEIKKVILVAPEAESFESLLKRLKEEEKANSELLEKK